MDSVREKMEKIARRLVNLCQAQEEWEEWINLLSREMPIVTLHSDNGESNYLPVIVTTAIRDALREFLELLVNERMQLVEEMLEIQTTSLNQSAES
jgi:hypothetical protein